MAAASSLGVIQLANRPLEFPGCLGNPLSYPYPVLFETAQDAYVSRIVAADPQLGEAYCEAAARLEGRGASAIIATCGFAVVYQRAVAARVHVPVLLSPLSLLPILLNVTATNAKVAILTYDSRQLDARFLHAAGVSAGLDRLVIAGIEDSPSWRALAAPRPELELAQLRKDVLDAAGRALRAADSIAAILLECSAFCPFAGDLRASSQLPVTDFHTAADYVLATARGRGAC